MEQIVVNLIENVIKYTKSGFVKINLLSNFETVKLLLVDTGIGIPEDDIPFMFDRFYRVEKSGSRSLVGQISDRTLSNNLSNWREELLQ